MCHIFLLLLVDVVGSYRLDDLSAQRVREAERDGRLFDCCLGQFNAGDRLDNVEPYFLFIAAKRVEVALRSAPKHSPAAARPISLPR